MGIGRSISLSIMFLIAPAVFAESHVAETPTQAQPTESQSPSKRLQSFMNSVSNIEFEVAEVKPCKSNDPPPGCRTLHDLFTSSFAINKDMISGEPGWMKSDLFEIAAKAPAGVGKPGDSLEAAERWAQMRRKLLIDRFRITYHFEDKLIPVYALTVSKQGLKLKPSTASAADAGCRRETQGETKDVTPGVLMYRCRRLNIVWLTSLLKGWAGDYIDRPVMNLTKLPQPPGGQESGPPVAGEYDFTLRWATRKLADGIENGANLPGTDASEARTIFQALREDLGLELLPQKQPVASIVIDHIKKLQ
jgi:uncharacterized protein (TIGR03435 family)